MLDALRNSSRSWLAKGLLLLLLASFAVWGISGQIAGGGGSNNVVTVGGTKVSATDYRLAYDRQLAVYSRQFGQRISSEEARQIGLDRMVLSQVASGAVLDEQARMMNLGLSKDRLAALVADDPAFRDANGQFSRTTFRQILRNVGMTEEEYIRNQQEVAIRQQISEAVSEDVVVPKTLLEAVAKHQGATRDIAYVSLGEAAVQPIPQPDDETLKKYFEAHKERYAAPEYRKIDYVQLTPEDIIDESAVTDDQVRNDYESNKGKYTQPEAREVQQLVFSDKEAAEAAHQRILAGQSFEDAVKDTGRTMNDVSLGTVKKSDIVDPAVADAAFSLKSEGAVSDVVDGTFGPVLVRVSKITPASVKPFEEVQGQIRHELALIQANDVLLDVHDSYEDARAGGATMAEAAKKQKLQMKTIDAVDAEGNTPDGKTVDIPEKQNLLSEAFSSDVGVDNPPLNAGRTGFLWYEVADIKPAHDRQFDEVRDRVTKDWTKDETSSLLDKKAAELAGRLEKGDDISKIAESEGLDLQNKYGLQRDASDPDFGRNAIAEIFDGGPKNSGYVRAASGDARFIFKVTNTSQSLGGVDALSPRVTSALETGLSNDLLDQLVAKLQEDFSVKVNQQAMDRALSFQ